MRYLLCVLLFSASAISFAQEQQEPEVVFNGEGKILMEDGTILEGTISYSFVNSTHVTIKMSDGKNEKIKRSLIKSFEVSYTFFEKISQGTGIVIGGDSEFAIRKTPEDSKIKVYETINQGRLGSGSSSGFLYTTHRNVIVYFPNQKPKPINDLSLSPFNKKVSKLVADCQELSEKIANKEDGYKIGLVTPPQTKLEIYLRIAEEYSKCIQ
jgi:hypothetical protein